MIRFIDLKGQILLDSDDPCCAFFTTVTDRFLEIDGEQEWWSLSDVLHAVNHSGFPQQLKDRIVRSIPSGYFD